MGILRLKKRFNVLLVCLLVLSLYSCFTLGNPLRNTLYDASIRKWSGVYTPEYPWYWNKAQLIAESGLNTNATSPVGAMGLGQFMPKTWEQMERELKFRGSAYTPSYNIQAQAYYMRNLRRIFRAPRPEYDKHSLALASYNAGQGNIIAAQKKAGNTLLWEPTSKALHLVTGHHSKETLGYVSRIWRLIKQHEHNNN